MEKIDKPIFKIFSDTNSQTLNSSTALNSSSNVQFGCGSKNCDQTKRRLRYIPFSKPTVSNSTEQCQGSSADDFPELFTRQQNENGAVILCFLIGLYGFTLLAIVCDSYFLPCVERICESMNLSEVSNKIKYFHVVSIEVLILYKKI